MNTLTVIIPTRNRWDKLQKTLNSIPEGVSVHVICDGDEDTYEQIKDSVSRCTYIADRRGSVYCRNYVLSLGESLRYICATDDVTFRPDAIQAATEAFDEAFPDGDGVVGFVQEPNGFHPTGVVLVDHEWLARYPKNMMYMPAYQHFSAQEIHWLASKLDKFVQCEAAVLEHLHPAHNPKEMDVTHKEARQMQDYDTALRRLRQKHGLIWGDDK